MKVVRSLEHEAERQLRTFYRGVCPVWRDGRRRQSFFPHVAFKYYINNGTQPLRAQAAAAVACNRVRVSDLHA